MLSAPCGDLHALLSALQVKRNGALWQHVSMQVRGTSNAVKQSALSSLRGLLTSKPAVWLCSMGDCRTVICSDKVALAIVDGTMPASLKLPVTHAPSGL